MVLSNYKLTGQDQNINGHFSMTRSHFDESESGTSTAAKNFRGNKFESDDEFIQKSGDFNKQAK